MLSLPPITLRLRGWKLIDRVALAFLVLCAIALGAGCGLLFVYASDLPEIRALETYRPDVVTEVYADDGQLAGSFALQRRILMTYEQCPRVLYNAVTAIEDQHFEEHWGIDFPRIFSAALRNLVKRKITGGASTISMQAIFSSTAATAASAAKCRKFFSRCRSNGATRNRKSLRCTQTKCTWHMGITVLPPPRNFISANRSRT